LLEAVEKENADDEVVRDYYMTLLKSNISQSMEEISSLQQEKNILQHMERLKQEDTENSEVRDSGINFSPVWQ
jgi:TAP42-like family